MSRPPRPLIHGGTYHVMNRGNRKTPIYADLHDRKQFLRLLINAAVDHDVEIQGGTQMGTHFHLIVTTPHANVSDFMQELESRYAEYFNLRHGLVGHLFQGTFVDVVIESDIQFFTAAWYVFANPCVGGYCNRFEDWPWSTFAATVGLRAVPPYLSISWIETLFPAESLAESQRLFRQCMEQPEPVIAYIEAVDPTTHAAVRSFISERLKTLGQPCAFREIIRPPLTNLFPPDLKKTERDRAIFDAKVIHGYTLAEIANVVRLNPGSVSRIFSDLRRARTNDEPTEG